MSKRAVIFITLVVAVLLFTLIGWSSYYLYKQHKSKPTPPPNDPRNNMAPNGGILINPEARPNKPDHNDKPIKIQWNDKVNVVEFNPNDRADKHKKSKFVTMDSKGRPQKDYRRGDTKFVRHFKMPDEETEQEDTEKFWLYYKYRFD